jgi:hypothetical protein
MGINIRVQDERGGVIRELLDPKSLVPMLLPEQDGHGSACLRFIDRYGDTYFNQIQIPVLLDELSTREHARGQAYTSSTRGVKHARGHKHARGQAYTL